MPFTFSDKDEVRCCERRDWSRLALRSELVIIIDLSVDAVSCSLLALLEDAPDRLSLAAATWLDR